MSFVLRDSAVYVGLLYGTLYLEKIYPNAYLGFLLRYVAFPYAAGIAMTGLWVLAHEAGHGAFSTNKKIADTVGFIIHSALMSPYFAWQSSHARHHQFANNISIDLNYGVCERFPDTALLPVFIESKSQFSIHLRSSY
jgi:bifunctional Delta-12/omega-3 fatty acid desaturase